LGALQLAMPLPQQAPEQEKKQQNKQRLPTPAVAVHTHCSAKKIMTPVQMNLFR